MEPLTEPFSTVDRRVRYPALQLGLAGTYSSGASPGSPGQCASVVEVRFVGRPPRGHVPRLDRARLARVTWLLPDSLSSGNQIR